MTGIFVGDVGTELLLDCGVSIATATVLKVIARTPKGGKKEWTGTLNGTTTVRYVLQTGDIDVAGVWAVQAYVEMPGWKGRGEWAEIKVSQ